MKSLNRASRRRVRPLFQKYFLAFFIAVVGPLLVGGAFEAWTGYHDQRSLLDARQRIEASAAADRIADFLHGVTAQLGWLVHLDATEANIEPLRIDAYRLLRQLSAVFEISILDGDGIERVRVSRIGQDVVGGTADRSDDAAFLGAKASREWYGPVTLNRSSEPYMVVALSGNRRSAGVVIATINLKLIRDIVAAISVGKSGVAYVVDDEGKLVAHPDLERVLRATTLDPAIAARGASGELDASFLASGLDGGRALLTAAKVAPTGWIVLTEQPFSEAFAPVLRALRRTALLLAAGVLVALVLAYLMARRLTGPVRLLQQGAVEIGAGNFQHRIVIDTGDELEHLADDFNMMAGELELARDRADRIARLRQFLSPQVAEIIERDRSNRLLDPRRAHVAVIFCDLRGFTTFSASVSPETIMEVLKEYYEAVGRCVSDHAATLTQLSGDGVMILLNAPLELPGNLADRAVALAFELHDAVESVAVDWRAVGHRIGFGIGLATGMATVGRIGYSGRHDYTAIGPVVNLASRLCSIAAPGQILAESELAAELSVQISSIGCGKVDLKGFAEGIDVSEFRKAAA